MHGVHRQDGRLRLLLPALALSGGITGGNREARSARAVAPAAAPAPRRAVTPFPAGSLYQEPVAFELAVYTPRPSKDPRRVLKELLAGEFRGLRRNREPGAEGLWSDVAVREPGRSEYPPPGPRSLGLFGHGLGKAEIDAVQRSERVVALSFRTGGEGTLAVLRDAERLLSALAHQTGGLIWDGETRELFSPAAWDETRVAGWIEGRPHVPAHTTIHLYQNGDLNRAITLGMGKFGLPDVVANDHPRSSGRPIGNLVNLACQTMAEKGVLETAGRLHVDIDALADATLKKDLLGSLVGKPEGKADLAVAVDVREEGDPQNRILELTFAESPGSTAPERQDALITRLFGAHDAITHARHDEALLEASRLAKAELPRLRKHFEAGLPPGERLLVKAPFKTANGGNEWMWIEVTAWSGSPCVGSSRTTRSRCRTSVPGPRSRREASLFDYLHSFPDGHVEGNETGRILKGRDPDSSK